MIKRKYTDDMLREFDEITQKLSSLNGYERICARLDLKKFIERHSRDICDLMFKELTKGGGEGGG